MTAVGNIVVACAGELAAHGVVEVELEGKVGVGESRGVGFLDEGESGGVGM